MLPRLIATDLDGTFLDPRGTYDHARLDRLLRKLAQHDSHFVVATGDPLDHVVELFGDLAAVHELTYVVEDGALTVTGRGEVLQTQVIPTPLVRTAITWIQRDPRLADNFLISCGADRAYTELPVTSARFRASQAFYPSLTHVAHLTQVTAPILKLDVTWHRTDVRPQVAAFNHRFAPQLTATSSGLGGFNVSLPGVNKATAVQALARDWQISSTQVAAFGDSGNDLALLQWAGQGIAVANAAPEILAEADQCTTRTNASPVVLDQIAAWLAAFAE
ncbi:HAD-IIB family hydrolase [Levilactobacillus zymae]|uniref:HAD-IIB family hydrolase n=1 Tax=Levilactobacillus zymae TaxID=267363 RepID=UPI0028BC9198|nr:HAD-IIB family hydrolase [Levilactobacillus zymae]MDT6981187.1 HAD-IIB family hydrolase [Levilactobacillus zymae]